MGAPALSMDYVNPVAPGLCRCTAGWGITGRRAGDKGLQSVGNFPGQ